MYYLDRKIEMFLPPKLTTILLGQLVALTLFAGSVNGQQADFDRRMAAMQEARARALTPAAAPVRVASADIGVDFTDPPAPPNRSVASRARVKPTKKPDVGKPSGAARVAKATQVSSKAPAPRVANAPSNYTPQHARTAQLSGHSFVDGSSPIISESYIGGEVISGDIISDQCNSCDSCCGGTYFEQDACCGRGGCPPGQPCLLTGLGGALGTALYNGEFFGGATAFRSRLFDTPGGNAGELSNDNSHGFYGGFNLGLPLCQLTGGIVSGQVGIRSVQTNFNGNEFTAENRDQLFITAGFFRRVDYGLQGGVVADILHEEWFTENDLVQIRGELGWVFGGGRTFGVRFATNTQDDITDGTFNGNDFTNLITSTEDTYRIFLRQERVGSGFGEIFVGTSELDQTIVGLDFDVAVTEHIGVQAGFNYYLNDEGLPPGTTNVIGGNSAESFNVFVGFVFRPRGRAYYNWYERPLFSVADNGSLLITRDNQ